MEIKIYIAQAKNTKKKEIYDLIYIIRLLFAHTHTIYTYKCKYIIYKRKKNHATRWLGGGAQKNGSGACRAG